MLGEPASKMDLCQSSRSYFQFGNAVFWISNILILPCRRPCSPLCLFHRRRCLKMTCESCGVITNGSFCFSSIGSLNAAGLSEGISDTTKVGKSPDCPISSLQGALLFPRAFAILEKKKASKPRRLCTVGRSLFQAEPISYFAKSMSC